MNRLFQIQEELQGLRKPAISVNPKEVPYSYQKNPAAAAVAIAGLGWTVYKGIWENQGDVKWNLERMDGFKHPWEQKDKYENIGVWKEKSFEVRMGTYKEVPVTGWTYQHINATFRVKFRFNGHSIGGVIIDHLGNQDGVNRALEVTATIRPDPQAYTIGGKTPIASLDMTFNYRFMSSILDDEVWIEDIKIYGDGSLVRNSRWTS